MGNTKLSFKDKVAVAELALWIEKVIAYGAEQGLGPDDEYYKVLLEKAVDAAIKIGLIPNKEAFDRMIIQR